LKERHFSFGNRFGEGEKLGMVGAEGVAFGFKLYKKNDDLFKG